MKGGINTLTGLSDKTYILGRREKSNIGILNIGRYYALDSSLGSDVYVDILRPHIVLICGKRGYGKSYTIGVFIEEIANLEEEVKNNLGVVVFDTLGIYWTTKYENKDELDNLKAWNKTPKGFDINLFVPKKLVGQYEKNNISVNSFSIKTSELTSFHWCELFNVKSTDSLGIALTRAILDLNDREINYDISDILDFILKDSRLDNNTKNAAENFLKNAQSWGVFDKSGMSITDFVKRGVITVLDISQLPDPKLKDIVTSIVNKKIFEKRVISRKKKKKKKMGKKVSSEGIPMVWLAIDEAQLFLPNNVYTMGKDVFINQWMRQGRQPGLSLIMATQRPSALDQEVLSHSDIILCHRLTAQEDIDSLSKIRPTYMHGTIRESIKKVGDERGVGLIVDDTSESSHIIKIRPRLSWHGGAESLVIDPIS